MADDFGPLEGLAKGFVASKRHPLPVDHPELLQSLIEVTEDL